MIMQNSMLDPQDLRKLPSMEDSTAMTIDFLRAKLLAERSISRSAKQRADELERKVMELEEQLRMVTRQRKMAEKATADVLAILENLGINDVYEEFDMGSDLESHGESGASNDYAKDSKRSMNSKGRQLDSDELSGSDVDSSPVSSRSLPWKGRHDSPRSFERYKASSLRRQSSFSSTGSSPRLRLGESCHKTSTMTYTNQVNIMSSHEGFPNCLDGGSNIPIIEYKIQEEDESKVNLANKNVDGYRIEKDMEEALKHQAQLLDQYETMEKAQRDWEEKFIENNSATPDSCGLVNHSDIAEAKDESKAQFSCSSKVVTSNAQKDKAEPIGDFLSEEIFSTSDVLGQEKSHSQLNGSQNERSVKCHCQASNKHGQDPHGHGYPDSKATHPFPTDGYGGLDQKDASKNNNDCYALVSHDQSHKFSGILESLKQAKISLQKELNRLPLVKSGFTSKAISPSAFVHKSEDRFGMPVGYPGLFRVPTDFSDEATTRSNVHDFTSGCSSNFYVGRHRIMSRTYDAQVCPIPQSGKMLSLPANDQPLATQYLENESGLDSKLTPYDPLSDRGLPSSGKYKYPMFPMYPLYQNATPQMPFDDGLSRPYSSRHSWGSFI